MPFKSDAQRRWANSPAGKKALGAKKLKEFNDASAGMELPERKRVKTKKSSDKDQKVFRISPTVAKRVAKKGKK